MSSIVSGPATSYDLLISAPDSREPLKPEERSDVDFNYNSIVLYFTYILYSIKKRPRLAFASFKSDTVQSPAMKKLYNMWHPKYCIKSLEREPREV